MRRRTHPQVTLRVGAAHQLGGRPVGVEELLGPVGAQPVLEDRQVVGVALHVGQRHLVRAPGPAHLHPVHDVRTGPALRGAQHDQRPPRPGAVPVPAAGGGLDPADPGPGTGQRLGEPQVHPGHVLALHLDHVVAVALEQRPHLGRVLAAQHRRAGDLGAVQVQDREHRPVARGVEERHALPGALQRAGLGLAVTHDRQRDQVRVVHHRAERVHEDVAQLATLVDRPRRRHRHVARDAAGSRELAEQPPHPLGVLTDRGIDLASSCPRGSPQRPEPGPPWPGPAR